MSTKKTVGYSAVISVTLTALVAGFLLSFIYSSFEKDIISNTEKAVMAGAKIVLPDATDIKGPFTDKEGYYPYYIAYNPDGSVYGYGVLADATGYNGILKVLVGFDSKIDTILGVLPTEHAETPGLGAKITTKKYYGQYISKSSVNTFSVVKATPELDEEIEAISGATISSTAVANAVNSAIEEARVMFASTEEEGKDNNNQTNK